MLSDGYSYLRGMRTLRILQLTATIVIGLFSLFWGDKVVVGLTLAIIAFVVSLRPLNKTGIFFGGGILAIWQLILAGFWSQIMIALNVKLTSLTDFT